MDFLSYAPRWLVGFFLLSLTPEQDLLSCQIFLGNKHGIYKMLRNIWYDPKIISRAFHSINLSFQISL